MRRCARAVTCSATESAARKSENASGQSAIDAAVHVHRFSCGRDDRRARRDACVTAGAAAGGRRGMRRRRRRRVARGARHRARRTPDRRRHRRARCFVAVRARARLRRPVVRRAPAAARRCVAELHRRASLPDRMATRRQLVTSVASDRRRALRIHVRCVRARLRPRTVSFAVARSALAAAVAEVDDAVRMELRAKELRPVRVRFAMAGRALALVVIGRWRRMAVATPHRAIGPRRRGSRAAARMTRRSGASPFVRIETDSATRERKVEPHVDVAVHVKWIGATRRRRRMARRACETLLAQRAGACVLRVRRVDALVGVKAAITRRIRNITFAVARRAPVREVLLGMAGRARRGAVCGVDDPCGSRTRTVMAMRARIAIARIEERRVATSAEELHVPVRSPWIREGGRMDAVAYARACGAYPSSEDFALLVRRKACVVGPPERLDDRENPIRLRAPDGAHVGICAEIARGCSSCVAPRTACAEESGDVVLVRRHRFSVLCALGCARRA